MRVFSNKNVGFRNRETNEIVVVHALEFAEVPEWVVHDPMYRWVISDGTLRVIDSVSVAGATVDADSTVKAAAPVEVVATVAEETPKRTTRKKDKDASAKND